VTVEELKARPEFVTLGTDQQREFVVAYCTNGADRIKAAESAYAVNDDKSALATANRNLRHPAIKRLITAYYGMTDETGSKTEALAIIWKQIQECRDPEVMLDYLKLYGEWKGFKAEKPAEEPAEETIDWTAKLAAVKGE
jgi:hypothetical protein